MKLEQKIQRVSIDPGGIIGEQRKEIYGDLIPGKHLHFATISIIVLKFINLAELSK